MPKLAQSLKPVGEFLARRNISANSITLIGFGLSLIGCVLIIKQHFFIALFIIIIARLFDALDGIVARAHSVTAYGAYLDITLDFIFYAFFVAAFGLADVAQNGVAALVLLTGFAATAASFLAFAVQIEKHHEIEREELPQKGFFYVEGWLEGSETYIFFIAMLLMPQYFPPLALLFAIGCYLTAFARTYRARYTL